VENVVRFASLISFTFVATAVTLAACSSGPANLPPGGGVGKVDSAGSSGSNANAVPQTSPTARPTPEFVYQLSYPRANTAGLAPLIDAFDLGTQTRFASYPTLLTSSNNFVAFARGFLSHDGTTVIIAAELTQGSSSFTTSTNVYRQAVAVAKPASQLRRPQEVVVQPSMAEIGPEGTAFQDAAIASDDTVYVLASVPGSIPAQQISTVRADGSLSTVPNPLPTFNTPQSIAVGPDNTLYIANRLRARVSVESYGDAGRRAISDPTALARAEHASGRVTDRGSHTELFLRIARLAARRLDGCLPDGIFRSGHGWERPHDDGTSERRRVVYEVGRHAVFEASSEP